MLAGKKLTRNGSIKVAGNDPFSDGVEGITYLGTEWANNPIIRRDISVAHLVASVGGDYYSERRDQLLEILDIDLSWSMHTVSDGERRRVQLIMGLMRPWRLLLLDEVTTDLDVLVRSNLLDFLHAETCSRDCAIVYATHIFDGLSSWPSHIMRLHLGQSLLFKSISDMPEFQTPKLTDSGNSVMFEMCLGWLHDDKKDRGARGEERRIKWEDVSDNVKHGDRESRFGDYFRMTRGMA